LITETANAIDAYRSSRRLEALAGRMERERQAAFEQPGCANVVLRLR
jgi:hypothetical protein